MKQQHLEWENTPGYITFWKEIQPGRKILTLEKFEPLKTWMFLNWLKKQRSKFWIIRKKETDWNERENKQQWGLFILLDLWKLDLTKVHLLIRKDLSDLEKKQTIMVKEFRKCLVSILLMKQHILTILVILKALLSNKDWRFTGNLEIEMKKKVQKD